MDFYLDVLAASPFRIPPGNLICTYEDIFTRLAPTVQTLLIVDDGNRFLDHLREQGKTVKNFFQWSVGDYPLPNLHTHLIFQPTAKDA